MRKYRGVDIGRIIFACLIPILHMALPGVATPFVQQYISRLGVPFFYAVSGMLLYSSLQKRTPVDAWKRYVAKITRLLLIWLVIYSPFIWKAGNLTVQNILFKTPAFLWYLTGLLVASIPFCFVRNRQALYACSAILYFLGTIFGDTYRWLLGGYLGMRIFSLQLEMVSSLASHLCVLVN